jgi:uncharacterized protein YbaR (Trm112 family)
MCPVCNTTLTVEHALPTITCPHCRSELVWARSTRFAFTALAILLDLFIIHMSGANGSGAVALFFILLLPCQFVSIAPVVQTLPPRYDPKGALSLFHR